MNNPDDGGLATINLTEAKKLIAAIDRLNLANSSMTKFEQFRVSCQISDDLRLAVFSHSGTKRVTSISASGVSAFLSSSVRLIELKALVVKGLDYIDKNKIQI